MKTIKLENNRKNWFGRVALAKANKIDLNTIVSFKIDGKYLIIEVVEAVKAK